MRSSAADRTRPTLPDGLVVLLLLCATGLLFWIFLPESGNNLTAAIVLDGKEVARLDLSALDGPTTLDLPDAPWPITVEADRGRIRVLHSDCPTQDCVHTGWVDRDKGQIICLPNRMVISLSGGPASGVDAVTG